MIEDYLQAYQEQIASTELKELRQQQHKKLNKSSVFLETLSHFSSFTPPASLQAQGASVVIGQAQDLSEAQAFQLKKDIETLIPWRKGPFEVFGYPIDAEWRSNLKWERFLPHLSSLQGKIVADIGSNNGYYMFRMLPQNPRLILGFEPAIRYYTQFQWLKQFIHAPALHCELLGIEHLSYFPQFFDTIFCMGILYHHPNPLELLQKMWLALKDEGELYIESLGIPGEESLALFPQRRYARISNIWFIPTKNCLLHWIGRSGFSEVECVAVLPLTSEEQRQSREAPGLSLKDFLNPQDPTRTEEGYPAPLRLYVKAKKRKKEKSKIR